MVCKFRAAMKTRFPTTLFRAACAAIWLLCGTAAHAEKADRAKPMVIEADKPGIVDLQRQVVVFNGNVQIQQGTMTIRAERVEIREGADGFRVAIALGSAGKPATYRQKREGVDETLDGSADRIEFDGRTDTLKLIGNGAVRRLRGSVVADEITGALIAWDHNAEVFSVQGGDAGRVRAVLGPRETPR